MLAFKHSQRTHTLLRRILKPLRILRNYGSSCKLFSLRHIRKGCKHYCAEFSSGREFCATTLVPQDVQAFETFAKDAHIVAQNSQAVENSAQLRLVPQDVQAFEAFAKDAHIVAQNSQAVENSAQLRLVP
jgi:hypothetical protein